ncbi:UDP-N-acetylmuramoyl-L-alanyl-D-glutamate--2,6-diaminopimelate ligase [Cellvibrio sp. pealriver]|uniref:UDP-N-acetylmuramoyl-L-alanyl-D-glutamate--2, 6-diaminopimelate ligase n=1 Tax=Cellvibrio sp. pealriver TaxID=1622269 RepID=UPI00066FB9CE|nr:UDP-N-acetylmuramoyl-L-alanyl-D-glutamate--2,6-diaminopimelate ligase [Cellvibrio sp. pealriver]
MTTPSTMRSVALSHLLPDLELGDAASLVVRNLCLDTRQLKTGDAFIALSGVKVDGRNFIAKAVELGAAVILVEADKNWQDLAWLGGVPVIAIENLPARVSEIAGNFFGEPSKKMQLIGITGTNGKTTCTLLAAQMLAHLQKKSAVIGTIGYGLLDASVLAPLSQQINLLTSTGLTTPDPITLQRLLDELIQQGAVSAAIEVSSHSLQQKRVAGLTFATAVFTNLTQDHLDYHGDLTTYGNVKAQLLDMPGLRTAIINLDDAWAASLQSRAPASVNVLSYSIEKNADVCATNIELHAGGVRAHIVTPWGEGDIDVPLLGKFNLSNVLSVIAVVGAQGFNLAQMLPLITQLEPAPGRMQLVTVDQAAQEVQVIVDYAHTPDALENTLNAIHQHKAGRVWTVFGCGGDRDKSKRPQMGKIAERFSDYVIVTNDNPRSEDPAAIAAEIVRGMNHPNGCLVIADRAQAIDFAIQQAKAGDIVLIAGKGHEDYQIFATQTLPFSDSKHARISLQRRIAKRESQQDNLEKGAPV